MEAQEKAMSVMEFLSKWAPKDNEKVRLELCGDVGSMCGELARRHDKNAVKEERRRVREAIDKFFAECVLPDSTLTKAALLESIYPPTPTVKKNWEDVTL